VDFQKKEEIIRQISAGKYYIKYKEEIFIYNEPSIDFLNICDLGSYIDHEEFLKNGYLTDKQEENLLEEESIWGIKDQHKYDSIKEDLERLKKEKLQYEHKKKNTKQIDLYIKTINKELNCLHSLKNTFYEQTIRYQVLKKRCEAFLIEGLFDRYGKKVWYNKKAYENECYNEKMNHFINKVFSLGVFEEKQIREVARSEPWRTKWRASTKGCNNLFSRNSSNYTDYQYLLCYWSVLYDSVFESMESPSMKVINNDDSLDRWLIEQHDKNKKAGDKEILGSEEFETKNSKIANSSEVFVMVGDKREAEHVYNTYNSDVGKRTISNRNKTILEKGMVKDEQLPDVKKELKMRQNREAKQVIKDRAET